MQLLIIYKISIKWKDDPQVEVLWELENELKEIYLDFVIKDNNLIWNMKSVMNQLEN